MSLFAFTRHAGLRATGRGRPVGRLKLLRSFGFCFAPQTPGAHSVGLAYAPQGARAVAGDAAAQLCLTMNVGGHYRLIVRSAKAATAASPVVRRSLRGV